MSTSKIEKMDPESYRTKVLIVGAILGAFVGVGAAQLYYQGAERAGRSPKISTGEGVRLGMLLLGLLRSVATLGEGDK